MISINANCQVGRQEELNNIHCNKYSHLQLTITRKNNKATVHLPESVSRRYNFYSCRNPFKDLQL